MPYRRLPATDQARLSAIRTAVQRASEADFTEQVLSYRAHTEAQKFLMQFENVVSQYHTNFNSRVSANKKYRHMVQNARMYISHFIQVLNLAVIRGEIKKEQKALYKLDPNSHILPDLSSEEDLLVWGKNIIDGELERTQLGGFPIYNPAINKVKVYYDIFKEHQVNQQIHRKSTDRVYEDLEELRKQADTLILDLWNQIEEHYKGELPYARLCHCKSYGIIYYYRTGEQLLTLETDKKLQKLKDIQPTFQWSQSE